MANLVIRRVDPKLVAALKQTAAKAGLDLNAFVKSVLAGTARQRQGEVVYHDLDHLAGTWTRKDSEEFARAVAPLGKVDKEMW